MELFLKISFIVIASLGILLICLRLLMRKILSNNRLFALIAKKFYNYYYSFNKINHLRTNNFGFAPIDEEVAVYEPDLRHGIQLYKELAKNHNGYMINENSSVVEVGCGKGAGAEFFIKKFQPKNYTGIDFSEKAIDFCTSTYKQNDDINFICADAQNIPLAEDSADVVVNVESSHLYKNQDIFFKEVYRILRTNGKFLFTDYRCIKKCTIDTLEKDLLSCGFSISEKRIITPQILTACMEASERRSQLVKEVIPWFLRKYFRHYAILNGSKKFVMLANGEIVYFIYHLEKK